MTSLFHILPLSPKANDGNHNPFLLQGPYLIQIPVITALYFLKNWKGQLAALRFILRTQHYFIPYSSPLPRYDSISSSQTLLPAVGYLYEPSQVGGARSHCLPQHNQKQLSSPCRTIPAVHKQSFVSPPLDSISFYLPPSGQICSKGRGKKNHAGLNLLETVFEKEWSLSYILNFWL